MKPAEELEWQEQRASGPSLDSRCGAMHVASEPSEDEELESLPLDVGAHTQSHPHHHSYVDPNEEHQTTRDAEVIDITSEEGMVRSERRQQRRLIESLRREARDPNWSTRTELELGDAFAPAVEDGDAILRIDCASSFCRVEVDLDDASDPSDRTLELMTLIPWEAQAFFEPDESGTASRGAIYFTRQGSKDFGALD